jgi:hypothetical protein
MAEIGCWLTAPVGKCDEGWQDAQICYIHKMLQKDGASKKSQASAAAEYHAQHLTLPSIQI